MEFFRFASPKTPPLVAGLAVFGTKEADIVGLIIVFILAKTFEDIFIRFAVYGLIFELFY
jgi:hypothetical protein